jgi:tetratricopeptide (TPR) repeat protein
MPALRAKTGPMPTPRAQLEEAARRLRAGDGAGAEACLAPLLAAAPREPDALHLLGLAAHRAGRHAEACAALASAVAARPAAALYRANLARALAAAGRLPEAEAALRAAIAAAPAEADLHYDLGLLLLRSGRAAEAASRLAAAAALAPADAPFQAEALTNLGAARAALGETAEAETCYRCALALAPSLAAACANLGALLCRLGRWAEAEQSLRRALEARPDFPAALDSLGTALAALGRPAEAEAAYRRALALAPDYADAHSNLGTLLDTAGRFAEAESSHRRALALNPSHAEAHLNLGNVLVALGRLPEAEASYRAALRLRPGEPEAEYNLGVALLSAGRLREGWAGYERRWDRRGAARREFPVPLWTGEPLGARRLLVHAEQGLGDTIQFCRFVPLLCSSQIIFEVPPALFRLLAAQPLGARIVPRGDPLPPFDLHCPLMSLPHRLGATLETIPSSRLAADPALAARWSARLAPLACLKGAGLKIGLAWAGNPDYAADRRRSLDPACLAPLLTLPNIAFISLQPNTPAPPPLIDWTAELACFADTAALIAALDLVISADTAAAHLAGALGKPVWLLNRFDSCWRWLRARTDSPWYPTLRQFRQPRPGDWSAPIAAVRSALLALPNRPARS